MNSKKNVILRGALCGAAIGGFILFFFGEGWLMAVYLLFEGAVIGAVIGSFIGIIVSWGSNAAPDDGMHQNRHIPDWASKIRG